MIRVGVTGNIGSGKTTVCKMFRHLGVPVYYADERGKYFLDTPEVKKQIINALGNDILDQEGNIARQKLAARVFNNADELHQLNAIIHPLVRADFQQWSAEQTATSYVIKEAAILIESGQYKHLDKIILVSAPEDIRIQRVCERDQTDADRVRQRAAHQMPEEEKTRFADYIIHNDGKQALIPQVNRIHKSLLNFGNGF